MKVKFIEVGNIMLRLDQIQFFIVEEEGIRAILKDGNHIGLTLASFKALRSYLRRSDQIVYLGVSDDSGDS